MVKRIYEIAESEISRLDQWGFDDTPDPSSARMGAEIALRELAVCSGDQQRDVFPSIEDDGSLCINVCLFEDLIEVDLEDMISEDSDWLDLRQGPALARALRRAADRVEEIVKANGQ